MKWKTAFSIISITMTSLSFGKENDQSKNHAQRLHDLIDAAIAQHKQVVAQVGNTQKTSSKSVFQSMLQRTQAGVNARINQLATASMPTTLPAVSDDLAALGQLWLELQTNPLLKTFISYCQQTYATAQTNVQAASSDAAARAILAQAWQDIGQAVFLAERFPHQMNALITPASGTTTQQQILTRCTMELQKVYLEGQAFSELQQAAGIQDPGLSLSLYEPWRIAKILLTKTGKLNFGMILLVRQTYVPATSPLEYQVGMDRVLASMNSTWQPVFDTIVKPQCDASAWVIRADLGLSPTTPLLDMHSKLTALKGLLSQLCQGAVGDCFAVSWAIKKHNEYLLQSLKDYQSLLQNGFLVRNANGQPEQFFFKNTLADDDLSNSIKLSSGGLLTHAGVMLWETPCFISACSLMGITNLEDNTPAAIKSLFTGSTKTVQTTPAQVIAAFANYTVQQNPSLDLATQLSLGNYGFSVTQNHLLRAWETALASMAEATSGDYVHDQVLSTLQKVMEGQWRSLKSALPQTQQGIVTQLQNAFMSAFDESTRYVYDGDIPLSQVSADGSSTDGGFEMYKKIASQPNSIGVRVVTPTDFSTHLVESIEQAAAEVLPTLTAASDQAVVNQALSTLTAYVQTQGFLKTLFYVYDDANKKIADPVANYQQLNSSPMTNLVGDNPYAVQAIDNGTSFQADTKVFDPKNPYALIKWILDLAKWKEQTQAYIEKGSPAELDPAQGPDHAFNINFEEPEIEAFVEASQTSDAWLQQYSIQPNMGIAQTIMDAATKQAFTTSFLAWLQQSAKLSQSDLNYVSSVVSKFNQQSLSIQAYATNFLSTIDQIFRLAGSQANEVSVPFDALFLQSLPSATQKQLSQTAIRFAKTNWNEGDKNLYFCTFFNPRTATLGFGTIAEDLTELNVMDEYQWVDQQEWDVAPVDTP